METPCVNVCKINPDTRMCEGCRRTIDEIASWSRITPAERRRIMDVLPSRTATSIAGPSKAGTSKAGSSTAG